jgi:hypothetical protein
MAAKAFMTSRNKRDGTASLMKQTSLFLALNYIVGVNRPAFAGRHSSAVFFII